MADTAPKYFCFSDANGNPVKVPLSEEEKKELSDAVHKALKQLEYNCRHPRHYTKEELEALASFIFDPPEFKPEEGETTDEN